MRAVLKNGRRLLEYYGIERVDRFIHPRAEGKFLDAVDFAGCRKHRMFHYTSVLKSGYRQELERLLFFNAAQHLAHSGIVDSIEAFGEPFVDNDGERLRINVRKLDEVQTLYSFAGDKLAGLLVYSRVSHESLVVIHIAVHEAYASKGEFGDKRLVMRMCQQLRMCARRIKGIEHIRMMYGNNRTRDYPVRRSSSRLYRQDSNPQDSTLIA